MQSEGALRVDVPGLHKAASSCTDDIDMHAAQATMRNPSRTKGRCRDAPTSTHL